MPLRLIPDDTKLPFMKWAKIRTPISLGLMVLSIVLLFTVGLNQGIDFKGGTVIEVRSTSGPADLADIREKISALELGDVEIQGLGEPTDAFIRVGMQPGDSAAQQEVVDQVQAALGSEAYEYRRVEVVGPRVSGELAWTGTIATVFTIVGIMAYIWFRFEWQFAIGAMATLIHDAILTVGFFAADADRLQPVEHRGDPDHHRLFAERHRRHLRPHPRAPAPLQADAARRPDRPRHQPDAGAHDHDVADARCSRSSRSTSSAAR